MRPLFLTTVSMEVLGWLEAACHGKEGLKYVSTTCGHLFVIVAGVHTMPKLCVPKLATMEQVHAYTIQNKHSILWYMVEGHDKLSFPGAQALLNSFFGDGTVPVLLNRVGCTSTSTNLLDCYFSAPYSYCQSGNTAGVICEGTHLYTVIDIVC